MLDTGTGFQGLMALVDALPSFCPGTSGQQLWYEERLPLVKQKLVELRYDPQVAQFVDRYSSILAGQLKNFIEDRDFEGAGEACIEVLEELVYQAKHYSQPAKAVECREEDASVPAANQPLALAA